MHFVGSYYVGNPSHSSYEKRVANLQQFCNHIFDIWATFTELLAQLGSQKCSSLVSIHQTFVCLYCTYGCITVYCSENVKFAEGHFGIWTIYPCVIKKKYLSDGPGAATGSQSEGRTDGGTYKAEFLGAFEKLRKTTISFITSVRLPGCLSMRPHGTTKPLMYGFLSNFCIGRLFEILLEKIHVWLTFRRRIKSRLPFAGIIRS